MKNMIGMILVGLAVIGCDDNAVVGPSAATQDSVVVKYDTNKIVYVDAVITNERQYDTIRTKLQQEVCYWGELKSSPGNRMMFCNKERNLGYSEFINNAKTCKLDTTFTYIDTRFEPNQVHFVITDTCMLHEVRIFK